MQTTSDLLSISNASQYDNIDTPIPVVHEPRYDAFKIREPFVALVQDPIDTYLDFLSAPVINSSSTQIPAYYETHYDVNNDSGLNNGATVDEFLNEFHNETNISLLRDAFKIYPIANNTCVLEYKPRDTIEYTLRDHPAYGSDHLYDCNDKKARNAISKTNLIKKYTTMTKKFRNYWGEIVSSFQYLPYTTMYNPGIYPFEFAMGFNTGINRMDPSVYIPKPKSIDVHDKKKTVTFAIDTQDEIVPRDRSKHVTDDDYHIIQNINNNQVTRVSDDFLDKSKQYKTKYYTKNHLLRKEHMARRFNRLLKNSKKHDYELCHNRYCFQHVPVATIDDQLEDPIRDVDGIYRKKIWF